LIAERADFDGLVLRESKILGSEGQRRSNQQRRNVDLDSRIRYTALSFPYHLGVAWFGGLAALARLRSSYTVEAEEVERTPAISESMETPSLFVLAFAACLLSVLIASRSCIGNRFEGLSAPALDFTDQATSRNLGNVVTLKSASARCGSCKNVSSPTLRNRSSDGLRVVERRCSVWPPT
jgi:hypothetical protein